MSATVIVSGIVTKPPEGKVAKTGRRYTSATLRDHDTNNWWWLTAYESPARETLLACKIGDAIRVNGNLQTSLFIPESGKARVNHAAANISAVELLQAKEQSSKKGPHKATNKTKKKGKKPLNEAELPF